MLFSSILTSLLLAPFALGNQGPPQNPADVLAIKHTLAQYPLLIDSKNFKGLSAVFTDDVYTDYAPPVGVLIGLPAVVKSLDFNLVNFTTQHSLTTQVIDIVSEGHAETTTYFIATHFGINETIYAGKVVSAYARYEDKLRVTDDVE